ncbi:MAG: adenosylcobinamide-GDP ribazoletransferase [Pseudomonadota bacterium]
MSVTEPTTDVPEPSGAPLVVGTLLAALIFFTRLPRPPLVAYHPAHDRNAAAFAPWIGILLGVFAAGALNLFTWQMPSLPAAALVVALLVWITGALHEDGFADFCDGFGTERDRETTLAIMRDPRTGVFGVTGLVLLLLLKVSLLAALVDGLPFAAIPPVVIAACALSRFAAISFMQTMPYARSDDEAARGRRLSTRMPWPWFTVAALGGLLPLAAASAWVSWTLVWVIPVSLLLRLWFAASFMQRLRGYTGDCLGAVQKVTEVAVYLTVAVLWLR